ncbi:hypothetical protein B0H17DRAFT_1201295 [Mycena rosella]|uniref:Uncharacterized protein n=1 Tax=Mycena rosella TaxID=1033263 RepID=A0AAD7GIW8_MYCRO|nr:hypothetical protein B0H17DRAFT_1201295 [Mycena rosella]
MSAHNKTPNVTAADTIPLLVAPFTEAINNSPAASPAKKVTRTEEAEDISWVPPPTASMHRGSPQMLSARPLPGDESDDLTDYIKFLPLIATGSSKPSTYQSAGTAPAPLTVYADVTKGNGCTVPNLPLLAHS